MSDSSELLALLPLLDEALDLLPHERAAWLANLQRTEPARAARLEAMLATEERLDSAGFLADLAEVPAALPFALAGVRLGAYTLERPLGRGGMGTVWLARRSDGRYEGVVAVKLLNLALLDSVGAARFRREGTMLARLGDPHIARLLDAGVTDTGQPYLVLEHVEGERIDSHCDARRLTPEARLGLFMQVLDAVAHAHANLIVHRDLKPSNILVTADGTVKLLDFGIAKLLEDETALEDGALTDQGGWALTPEYAAPEQVTGGPVTTATDVYALGILLYVLLTGRHPTGEGSQTRSDHLTGILETEPSRLSAAVTPEAATARGSSAERLRRHYAGDLENIVAKALRKDPTERYASIGAFADDLQRYLSHQPVRARSHSLGYRTVKFVRRNRTGVAVAASLLALLAAGAWRERVLRYQAETETRKATEVGDYLVSVFDVANPFSSGPEDGGDVTARELLERGARRVDSSLAGQPEVQAQMRGVFGRAYAGLGLFDESTVLLRQALADHQKLHGDQNLIVAADMDRLGHVLVHRDRYDEAEPLLREALAQRRLLLGSAHSATAETLDHLATLYQRRQDYAAAEPLFREALAIRRGLFADTAAIVGQSLNNLGVLLFAKSAYDQAEAVYREALAIEVRRLGENHPQTAQTLHNLAQTRTRQGKFAEAESLYRRALAAKRKTLGDDHPTVAVNLNNLGSLLLQLDRVDEAEPVLREALAIDRKTYGEQHSHVAQSLRNLARVMMRTGQFAEADRLSREALAINRTVLGQEHSSIAMNLNDLGNLRRLAGDMPGAVRYFRESIALARRTLGDDHFNTQAIAINLGRALVAPGTVAEAERLLRGASSRLDTANAAHRPWYVNAQSGLGLVLVVQGRAIQARDLLEPVVRMARGQLGEGNVRTADAELALGRALLSARRYADAEPVLRAASAAFEKQRTTQPYFAADAAAALAELRRHRPER
jgi:eukaryotic-like serine/threonine-protein kinase